MKKIKQMAEVRLDNSKPTKPDVSLADKCAVSTWQIPTYDGPTKTDKMPKKMLETGNDRTKVAFKPEVIEEPKKISAIVDFGDQQPKRAGNANKPTARVEQYIRMRIRVNNGHLSVIDSHLVDGPLGQAKGFPGSNAYEVTLGDRLLHAGALPDLGVQRSFSNLNGPLEQQGHHFTYREVYEFMARVPASEITPDTIGKIVVRLYRVKEEARVDHLGLAPLGNQFIRQMRVVAELSGLPESVLPDAIELRGSKTPTF